MLIDLKCPVENLKTIVKTSSETQKPYLLLKLLNISDKTITSVDLEVKVLDDAGNDITSIPVELTGLRAQPKEFFAENKAVSLDELYDEKQIIVIVRKVTFENNDVPYEYSEDNLINYDDSEASLKDATAIRELFPDAVCFSEENENYWRCPCGRPNSNEADVCVRCGSEKEDVLKKFTSKSALNAAIKEKEEQDRIKAEEDAKALALKKKKLKKNIIIGSISAVILIILVVAGYFIYGAVNKSLQNKKAEELIAEGNYLEAYKIYCEMDSDKKYDIQHHVMGNTPENSLYALGTIAEDNNYLYYVAYSNSYPYTYNLVKKNKSTGEVTQLTEKVYGALNVVGDYIYFVNEKYFPCRINKNGGSTEILFEKNLSAYMTVIGNDMYYIGTDYANPNNLSEEQCQTLVAQGQMTAYSRLHRYNLDTKIDTLISQEEMRTCLISDKRIYFLTYNNDFTLDRNLKSMDMKGNDIKIHVDSPVISFSVKGDIMYYITQYEGDYMTATEFSEEYLGYAIKSLNLSNGVVTTITDSTDYTTWLSSSGDLLIYTAYDRAQYISTYYTSEATADVDPIPEITVYNTKTGEKKIIANLPSDYINTCGDTLYSISSTVIFMMKTNGENAEPIYGNGTSTPSEPAEAPELSSDLQDLVDSLN